MKTISSKNIISKVFRDFGNEDTSFVHNAIEWIGETLERIGTTVMYQNKVCKKVVENHRTTIPSDCEKLEAIVYNGMRLPKGSSQRSVGFAEGLVDEHQVVQNPILVSGLHQGTENQLDRVFPYHVSTEHFYSLNPNYILTSFEEGEIEVYYRGFPIDNKGFPLIWDNVYVREACSWGIISKMLLSGFRHSVIDFQYATEQYDRYLMLARNSSFPGIDDMERFRNMWVRLVPDIEAYKGFFDGSEIRNDVFK